MKKFLINYCLLVFLCFISSCVLKINTNEYSGLDAGEKAVFRPFSMEIMKKTREPGDSFRIYEITAQNIKSITRTYKYTWVHFWAPYCKSSYCSNTIGYMCNLKNNKNKDEIATVLISTIYDVKDIQEAFKNSALDCQVFVLSNSCYGEKQEKGMKKFASELDNNSLVRKNRYFSNYFFKDTMLINASWDMDGSKVDSFIRIND